MTTIFLKLGGSLITDKTGFEALRSDVLERLAQEIYAARQANPTLRLVLGHGSGSFGHVFAAKHGTRQGVGSAAEWFGFAEVSASALRLNRLVKEALLAAGVPAISLSPSASVRCENGRIVHIVTDPIKAALDAGLVPITHGDVAFDSEIGGTIISTEEIMMAMADALQPRWLLLGGETAGVYDLNQAVLPLITRRNLAEIQAALGGSRGTDVTGGMSSKVNSMLQLVAQQPQMGIRIFSGLEAGLLQTVLQAPETAVGTVIRHELN
ncbi:MAG: isopentenyl phosphate kinase [Chloroflexota bacterium]